MPALFKAVPRLSGPARQHAAGLIEAVVGAVERSQREEAEWAKYLQEKEERRKQEEEQERERQAMEVEVDVAMVERAGVDLWSRLSLEQKGPAKLARTSALFSSKPPVPQPQSQSKQKASHSALFGQPKHIPAPIPAESAFDELRRRIHGAISDAPRMAVVEEPIQQSPPTEPTLAEPAPAPPPPEPSTSQPAFLKPQLGSDLAPESDDIVLIAQPRSKSKKRKPPTPDSGSGPGSKKAKAGPQAEPIAAFDYASAPNILDQEDDAEDGSKGRKKEKKKATSIYGNFPAPPKAQSEQRSGNRTFTFK
ncbi:hypothetical protein FRC08_015794 [Ceratobasidium sp. 394]|nr:hypothetical protein FRC08_015794 [Ceratobasidium sp. 394]